MYILPSRYNHQMTFNNLNLFLLRPALYVSNFLYAWPDFIICQWFINSAKLLRIQIIRLSFKAKYLMF